ncbi:MAG: sensor domain-containing diguanylate cyclase [Deltaproteobacteria bacterium]|nr:sensor domain-containing diguanylate cyclase [Deltaproteobacteria bacterium]
MKDSFPFKTALEAVTTAIYCRDKDRKIVFWNAAAERLTGYTFSEVENTTCANRILCHHSVGTVELLCETDACPLVNALRSGEAFKEEFFIRKKSGTLIPVVSNCTPVYSDSNSLEGFITVLWDNTRMIEMRSDIENLESMALADPLTGLGNRRYAEMNLTSAMEKYRRYGWNFGLLFFDIDHFKDINDRYGHVFGDKVLKTVSTLLKYSLRSFDTIARWGGEEFLAVICNVDDSELGVIAERGRKLVGSNIMKLDGEEIKVTVSVGVTSVIVEDTVESIVKRVDSLMYRSKTSGRNRVTLQIKTDELKNI